MNSDLQNKLQQFSADPPEGVWNKIANALDTEETFAQRLYAYEQTPPHSNWEKIERQLSVQPEPARVIPFGKRFTKPMRYIAVAGILAIILVTITLTTERTEAGALETGTTTVAPANLPTTTATLPTGQKTNPGQQSTAAEQPAQNNSNENLSGPPVQRSSPTAGRRTAHVSPINALRNDYVTYNDGNGKVMKVSRKMETFINCKDGDWQCKQRLQQLRQKLATKAMTTDFTGILEMLQQLQ